MPKSSDSERASWDRRYQEGSHSSDQPDPFLQYAYSEFVEPLFPQAGTALDVAGGVGRHAMFLAEHGWHVTLVDISAVGIKRARSRAAAKGLDIIFQVADTGEFNFGRGRFDLVIVFFYLERSLLAHLAAALRPGGLIVYKTYTRDHQKYAARALSHPMYFLDRNELLHAFPGFTILHYCENVREKGLAELVARKPA